MSDKARLREELDDVRTIIDAQSHEGTYEAVLRLSLAHQRLLKSLKSLNDWAVELEATGHIGRFIAAELRRRMETP